MKLNTDKATTLIGALAMLVVGANIDFAKLIEGDGTQITLLAVALAMGGIGWLCNKLGWGLSAKSKAALEVLIAEVVGKLLAKREATSAVPASTTTEKGKAQ